MGQSLVVRPRRSASEVHRRADIRLAALRVPLALKLLGANVLVVCLLLAATFVSNGTLGTGMLIAAGCATALHLLLVFIALRPIHELEVAAERVWRGDFATRVELSAVADDEVLRIGSMFNVLLDAFASDRVRLQRLATSALETGDADRASIARALRESTAQNVAGLLYQIAAVARDAHDPALVERLAEMRDATERILDQVRELSQSVHSTVLDDLGLDAALRRLTRTVGAGLSIDFDVHVESRLPELMRGVTAALYHVAEEAVDNAARHASATRVRVSVHAHPAVTLEVHDDGIGFDANTIGWQMPHRGLTSMRERLALFDGTLEINTVPGGGTTVVATIPLNGTTTPSAQDGSA